MNDAAKTTEHKTRYTVGEKLYGIVFEYESGRISSCPPFIYSMEKLAGIRIVSLDVIEHHKVRDHWDPVDSEPNYDGFILKDQQGQTWHNQYPTASYGQMSDETDRQFTLDINEENKDKVFHDTTYVWECGLLTSFMKELCKGIRVLSMPEAKKDERPEDHDEYDLRLKYMKDLKELIENTMLKDHNKRFEERVIWVKYPDITRFVLVDA